jgi:hypothetical protein
MSPHAPQREKAVQPCALISHLAGAFPDYKLPDHEKIRRTLIDVARCRFRCVGVCSRAGAFARGVG